MARLDRLIVPPSAGATPEDRLRVDLVSAQYDLLEGRRPAIVIVAGVNLGGKGDVVRYLNQWFDPRHLRTQAFGARTEEELQRPAFWRYWMSLPARGHIAINVGSWYNDALAERSDKSLNAGRFEERLSHINQLEADLVADGALILKYWLQLSRREQRARVKALRANPATAWRVTKDKLHDDKHHRRFLRAAKQLLSVTDTAGAPWAALHSVDVRTTAHYVGADIARRLANPAEAVTERTVPELKDAPLSRLAAVDLGQTIDKADYRELLVKRQAKLSRLQRRAYKRGISTVIVFEGWDAAGKGGAIRRITFAIDPRQYRVIRIGAPSDEELAHHYLWRFWRHVPRAGHVTIYDRSWYGRVLVERVEGFAEQQRWRAAYDEINDFEQSLVEHGTVVVKFWLHMSPEEQLQRFRARENTPYKRFKITDEDYRNRDKWSAYEAAANEMLARTSSAWAPWQVIAANDKRFARCDVLDHVCRALKKRLSG